MAQKNKRRREDRPRRRPVVHSERYSIRALHEDREYGLYWYAWLWKLLRPVVIFICSVLVVVGMVHVGYERVYDAFLAPVSDDTQKVSFVIENGDSVTKIGNNLEKAQLLKNHNVFKYLVQFQGLTNSLSYGTFQLSPSMNVSEIIAELTSGSQTNERVITIVPGWTCDDIADYLLAVNHFTGHVQFFHQDSTDVIQPALIVFTLIFPFRHVHQPFDTYGKTLIIVNNVAETAHVRQVLLELVKHDNGQGGILVCLVDRLAGIVKRTLAADDRPYLAGEVDTCRGCQAKPGGVVIQPVSPEPVRNRVEEIVAGVFDSFLDGLVGMLVAQVFSNPALRGSLFILVVYCVVAFIGNPFFRV